MTADPKRPLSGWCSTGPAGARPKCRGCQWQLCQCPCHTESAANPRKVGRA